MGVDWGADTFDWRNSSLDKVLATEWLRNERLWRGLPRARHPRVPDGYDLAFDGWARELVMSDLDPERGWRLVLLMVESAEDDKDLSEIGDGPLYELLKNHEEFLPRARDGASTDPRFRKALDATTSWNPKLG
jgi:hypothetical protein